MAPDATATPVANACPHTAPSTTAPGLPHALERFSLKILSVSYLYPQPFLSECFKRLQSVQAPHLEAPLPTAPFPTRVPRLRFSTPLCGASAVLVQ